jgi:hypothetical protein
MLKKILRSFLQYIDNPYLRKILVRIGTIDEFYSNLQKSHPVSPETITTPEVKHTLFHWRAEYLQKETYSLPLIYSVTLRNVIYSPKYNIILTNSRKVISDSINTDFFKDPKQFSLSHLFFKKVKKIPGFCSIFRSTNNSYYHTLIDNIPRLYLLAQPEYSKIPEIKLLFSNELTKAEKFFIDKCCPNNVKPVVVNPHQVYSCEEVIFPSFMSQPCAGYLPKVYLKYFLDKVIPQRSRRKKNRIFISRGETKKGKLRCILNEDDLFHVLKNHGFQKYNLERMSIEEQIETFYDADYVVAAHGAGLSNIIFSDAIKLLELFPTQFILPHYYYLSKALDHSYRYWCGEEESRDANFQVNVSEIESMLNSFE